MCVSVASSSNAQPVYPNHHQLFWRLSGELPYELEPVPTLSWTSPRTCSNLQVKEQLFRRLSGELPYELEPVPTEARRLKDGALLLKQTLFVRSESVRASPPTTRTFVSRHSQALATEADPLRALGVAALRDSWFSASRCHTGTCC